MMLKTLSFLFLNFLRQFFFPHFFFHLNTTFMLAGRNFQFNFSIFTAPASSVKLLRAVFRCFNPSFGRQIWNPAFRKQNHSAPRAESQHDAVFGCDSTDQTPIKRPLCAKSLVFSCGCQCLAGKRKQEKVKNLPSDKLGNRHRVQKSTKKYVAS